MERYLTGFYVLTFSLLWQVAGATEAVTSQSLPPVYLETFERLDSPKRETLKDFYSSTEMGINLLIIGISAYR